MNKRVYIWSALSILILVSFYLVMAVNETDTTSDTTTTLSGFEKGYSCLESKLGDNCGASISTEQTAYSLLAGAYTSSIKSGCKSSLESLKQTNCWAATKTSSCDLKSTSQAVIALKNIGQNTKTYTDWILSKRKLTTGLSWFLEIDTNEAASCTVKSNNNPGTFTINSEKKISGSSSCLTPAENNYFLKISDSCLGYNFSISCDKEFITTLLYKKSTGSTFYVSSKTNSAQASGTTNEKVNSYCFGLSSCDYEGSMWATTALSKAGEDITPYIPYLSSEYDTAENKAYFPSSFLYMLTGDDEYQSVMTGKQQQGKFWKEGSNEFYDTALAILALQSSMLQEIDNSKEWLLSIQESSGCWHSNNLKDTALILYAVSPKNPIQDDDSGGRSKCTDFSHFCVASEDCGSADLLNNFYCSGLSSVCCSVEPLQQTCAQKTGIICEDGFQCTGGEVISSDGPCCIDSCVEVSATTECEDFGNVCQFSCDTNQEEKLYSCNSGEVCCAAKASTGLNWWIIILLIILIVLVGLAILFRNQLKVWFFRFRGKVSTERSSPDSRRPSMPPPGGIPMFQQRPRQVFPRQMVPRRPMPARRTEKDSAFDETMRKLREMTK